MIYTSTELFHLACMGARVIKQNGKPYPIDKLRKRNRKVIADKSGGCFDTVIRIKKLK